MPEFHFAMPLAIDLLGQNIVASDLMIVGLLVVLEGLLSIDNALVLGMLAKRLPKQMRAKALSFGLIGAFFFRVIAILLSSFLLKWTFVKFLGGAYLVFIALKHLFLDDNEQGEQKVAKVVLDEAGNPHLVDAVTGLELDFKTENVKIEQRVPVAANLVTQDGSSYKLSDATGEPGENDVCDVQPHMTGLFWKTVLVIELTDIAFAVDSILAAMALAGSEQDKLWVVITGGILGVILMRFAAALFVRLLERFPRFETSAYLLVLVIGFKLLADWACNSDWSFSGFTFLGSWQEWFQSVEHARLEYVEAYEEWLVSRWPLGMSEAVHHIKHAPPLINFHDLRRPESLLFWSLMLASFLTGFWSKQKKSPEPGK